MTNQDLPKYGFVSPGWPISRFPNGIVSYIHNIKQGFTDIADISVLSTTIETEESEDKIYKIELSKNLMQKMQIKVLTMLPYSIVKKQHYNKTWKNIAKSIEVTLKKIPDDLSIIEVEDTFGIAKWLKPMIDIPIITRLHGPFCIHGSLQKEIKGKEYQDRINAEGDAIKLSDGITSPSKDVLDRVREYYGVPLDNAVVIPNPVPTVPEALHWKYDSKHQVILFVGRFDFHKGADIAIQAFNIIATHNKAVELYFIGQDLGLIVKNKTYNIHQYLEEFIINEDVRNRIHVLGQLGHEVIQQYRSKATITLVTSVYEVFSISMVEALATGSPVVASNIGAIPEIINDGHNGYLADVGDYEMFAKISLHLLNNPEKLNFISKNAIEDTKSKYSPEVVAEQTQEYYRSIII